MNTRTAYSRDEKNNNKKNNSPFELELSLVFSLSLLEAQGLEQQQRTHQGGQLALEGIALRANRLVPVEQWCKKEEEETTIISELDSIVLYMQCADQRHVPIASQ